MHPAPRESRQARHGHIALMLTLACAAASCSDPTDPSSGDTGGATDSAPSGTTSPSPATSEPTTGDAPASTSSSSPASTAEPDETTTTPDPTATTTDDASTGPVACAKNVVLMGYWPPTNEMLRPWSQHPEQNPDGWVGENWGGYGYDVYSFFPEFPPDGDPTNDEIGDDGAVGSPDFDLRVDYQATSADFWRIVGEMQPVILVTTSRGGEIGWEIEALEGGHGQMNPGDASMDWTSDKYGDVFFPTEDTIEAASWDAISTYRQGNTLPSQLPLDDIFAATDALGVTDVVIAQDTSGNFLSGFLGLHGVYYNLQNPHNVAAGHIHVGFGLPVESASMLIEATLHAVLTAHPSDGVDCP